MEPFLYRHRKLCNTVSNDCCVYDDELNMLVSFENHEKTLAILTRSLGTKKENLEKGEDEGPSLFWQNI